MIITYTQGPIRVEQQVGNTSEAFQFLSRVAEVFGVVACGQCHSEDVYPSHRQPQGFDFHEWKCRKCGCALQFGVTKEGHDLFPRRKDENGDWLPSGGWVKREYQPTEKKAPSRPVSHDPLPF